ncbi:putative phosphatidylglycerol/phosphatidylinositol transfer protein DDB_G0278295 [Dysidea avara]|uniref:putative phosphatidylglycerol/phosphatidylinositol transfer protein DDB_G0278295 n=1 Tax=Dysidea avara TaxID=196820 RepID=UPI0033173488
MSYINFIVTLVLLTSSIHNTEQGRVQIKCWAESCTKQNAQIQNVKVDIYPIPPELGKNITILLSGTILEKVNSGRIYGEARFNNFPPLRETYDLCYILSYIGVLCPLVVGDVQYNVSKEVPRHAIPGNYTFTGTATDQMNNELLCLLGGCVITG